MSPAETKHHLQKVHGLNKFKGKRTLALALDGQGYYNNSYEIEIGEVKLYQNVQGPSPTAIYLQS